MTFEIPDRIANYVRSMCGCNLQVNYNETDALNGYGGIQHVSVYIQMLTRRCSRCGYDEIWNPDDRQSKCNRHTLQPGRYDDVFVWKPECRRPLESCFDEWLSLQPTEYEWPSPMIMRRYT